ncbi:MAG: hypothetical protein ACK5XA_08400 [Tagaea sp.]
MNIVIDHLRLKRTILGPFALCASRAEFESIARQIQERLAVDEGWSYGWIEIHDKPVLEREHNQHPIDWRASP